MVLNCLSGSQLISPSAGSAFLWERPLLAGTAVLPQPLRIRASTPCFSHPRSCLTPPCPRRAIWDICRPRKVFREVRHAGDHLSLEHAVDWLARNRMLLSTPKCAIIKSRPDSCDSLHPRGNSLPSRRSALTDVWASDGVQI